jgi:hypothetical protein
MIIYQSFLYAATLVRCECFSIKPTPSLTRHAVKEIVGDIIPAVASTNAVGLLY